MSNNLGVSIICQNIERPKYFTLFRIWDPETKLGFPYLSLLFFTFISLRGDWILWQPDYAQLSRQYTSSTCTSKLRPHSVANWSPRLTPTCFCLFHIQCENDLLWRFKIVHVCGIVHLKNILIVRVHSPRSPMNA